MNDGTTYLIFLELPVKDLWGTLVPICRVALIKKVSPNYGGRVHRNTLGAHLTKLGVWRYAGTQRPTPKSRTRTTPRDQGRDPARRSPNGDRWLFWLLTALGLVAGDKLSRPALQVRLPPKLNSAFFLIASPGSAHRALLTRMVAVRLEWIPIAESADAANRLLALLEGIEAAVRATRAATILRTPGGSLSA
jgi:hypothetical protein